MKWHVVVRVNQNDDFTPSLSATEPRFFVDFENPTSHQRMRQKVANEILKDVGIHLEPMMTDFLHMAMAAYAADRCINRSFSVNGWEREIILYLPVVDFGKWKAALKILIEVLNFLSGDKWKIYLRKREAKSIPNQPKLTDIAQDICLFSGGVDSLVGVIDLLESGKNIIPVGHYGAGMTHQFQSSVSKVLKAEYDDRFNPKYYYVEQPHIDRCDYEQSMRTRSILFLALGLALASTQSTPGNLYVPENGLISLNVPLTKTRLSSLSTRTTHPSFINLVQQLLDKLGIANKLVLPYRYKTKGEMLEQCVNRAVLDQAIKKSMSCSHPEQARWAGKSPGLHCGRCFPCIIRLAAVHKAGSKDNKYVTDILRNPPPTNAKSGSDYRAIMIAIERYKKSTPRQDLFNVLSTGSIPQEDVKSYVEVYQRGMNEVAIFLIGAGRS